MRCDEMLELISASLDGELTPDQEALLTAHLEQCSECRALHAELSGIHEACGELETAVPDGLKEQILKNLPPRPKAGKVIYWKRWGAIAAVLAVVALAAWRLPHSLFQRPDQTADVIQDYGTQSGSLDGLNEETVSDNSTDPALATGAIQSRMAALDQVEQVPAKADLTRPVESDGETPQMSIALPTKDSEVYCGILTLSDFQPDKDYPAEEPFPGGMRYTLPAEDFQSLVKALEGDYDLRLTGPDIDPNAPWGLVMVITGER